MYDEDYNYSDDNGFHNSVDIEKHDDEVLFWSGFMHVLTITISISDNVSDTSAPIYTKRLTIIKLGMYF